MERARAPKQMIRYLTYLPLSYSSDVKSRGGNFDDQQPRWFGTGSFSRGRTLSRSPAGKLAWSGRTECWRRLISILHMVLIASYSSVGRAGRLTSAVFCRSGNGVWSAGKSTPFVYHSTTW
jgi:hypothetical protein